MRRVDDLEDVVARDKAKARVCGLQVINGLTHIAFSSEDERGKTIIAIFDLFGLDDLHQTLDHLCVGELGVAQDGASRLKRLDDLVGLVACKCEARGVGVDFHGAAKSLLGTGRHAVCFVEDDELVAARGKGHFFLGKTLDAVADDVDAALVTGVELENGLLVRVAEQFARQAENAAGLADTRHAGDDDVRHVSFLGDDLEALNGFDVADYVVEKDWSVLFNPISMVSNTEYEVPRVR